ncbi:MAG: VOC family protein [Azospirillaceae bacterium]|nr:VOC family protein [Azospirillaceae bacterium]
MTSTPDIVPRSPKFFALLRYENPAAAVEWLCGTFGFGRHYVASDERGRVVHAQLRLGDDLVMLGPDNPVDRYGMHSPRVLNGLNQGVCVALADVDAHYVQARAAGAEILTEIHDTDYGAREYVCRDPEGHVWTFGNYWGEP